jgi:protein-S-isoprenylcysteine O-methyltransferase Ste14
MGLDIRLPIGMLFTIFGIMLIVFGLFSNPALYAQSLGININLAWGIVLLVFGAIMLFLGARSMFFSSRPAATPDPEGREPRH